jgi:uncharacterized protein (TIGR03435 family)
MRRLLTGNPGFDNKALVVVICAAVVAGFLLFSFVDAPVLRAQSATGSWEKAAGGKMSFDVASVKQNISGLPPVGDNPTANFPLDDGNAYAANGALLSVTNFPLQAFIDFAYKLTPSQVQALRSQLPKWATTQRFDLQAHAPASTTKDQMRLMMQSLLADRLKFAAHMETREAPVFGLVLAKPGKLGIQLHPYSSDPPCPETNPTPGRGGAPSDTTVGDFPLICYVVAATIHNDNGINHFIVGSRNISMQQIANDLGAIPSSNLDRPVVDQTGLTGEFDFVMRVTLNNPASPVNAQPDDSEPSFPEALSDQLGLKLVPQTGPVDVLVIDHIEQPSPN